MSYILESLKKSEQERREKAIDSPIEQVYESVLLDNDDVISNSYKRYLIVLCVVLLLILLVGVVFSFVKNDKATKPVKVFSEQSNNVSNQRKVAINKKIFDQSLAEKAEAKKTEIDDLYQQLEFEKRQQQSRQQADKGLVTEKSIKKQENKVTLSKSALRPVEQGLLGNDENRDVQPLDADANKPKVAEVQKPLIPYFNTLSILSKDNIPSINYSAHIYAEDNRSGFVMINGSKQQAGSKLANGIFLEKIEEDAIVLSFDGLVFKMPAMTSWINR